MDYRRRIGKPKGPKKWVEPLQRDLSVQDSPMYLDERNKEAASLVNWRKWLANRQKQYKRIESYTGRHRTDQLLNSCEKIRPFVEMKNIMYYASIPVPVTPDKFRGGPEFWRTPQKLPNRDPCLPDITITPSKQELNVLPELTFVDLPELIEKEKDLVGLRSKVPLWERSPYLMKRKRELSNEIKLLVPKEPETRDLVIVGHDFVSKKRESRLSLVTIFDTEEDNECDRSTPRDQTVILSIQDRDVIWQPLALKDDEVQPIEWNLFFSGQVEQRIEKEIVFENKGNRVIVYEWRNASIRLKTIPSRRRPGPFFFNKTKGVILLRQIVKLTVCYRPRIPGIFSELWRLKTDPVLCPSPLIIRLSGCAKNVDITTVNDPVSMIDGYLDRCIRDVTIREIIEDILENVHSVKPPEPFYGSLFLESDVFAIKNPLCFYYPSLVLDLHKIYQNATNQYEKHWNLSLEDLRETLLRIKEPRRRHDMLSQFSRICKECLKPVLPISVRYGKREMVYNLLCTFFNRFEDERQYAKCFAKRSKESVDEPKTVGESNVSVKGNNSRSKRGRRLTSTREQSGPVQDVTIEQFGVVVDDRAYKEVFFIRVYQLLKITIGRVLATIDSFDNLNKCDR
ncbi:MYCBP-associated protein [Ptiloglossa arizonensis]|uniref:MYCBP-associated protein n=1 Tax=Ptiloglossa arizonensis TaxID=3350558 RepID=UPI003F9FF109